MNNKPFQNTVSVTAFTIASALLLTGQTAIAGTVGFTTTITVDTTTDPQPDANNTCTFNGPLGYAPAVDTLCSLRRALNEASLRPVGDRPILIQFNLPANEENIDVAGTWTITMGNGDPLGLIDIAGGLDDGMVTIDGATQPDGRNASEGPSVFINTAFTIDFDLTQNTLQNIGIYGGGSLQLDRISNQNTVGSHVVDNIWMGLAEDGQTIVLENNGNPAGLAGGGIAMNSDGNIVQNSVIAGADGRAVDISNSARENNQILNNSIGTRGDGTVPDNINCTASLQFNPANWYGGEGIRVLGKDHVISGNTIAGLNNLRSTNDTPPIAIEVGNAVNISIDNNQIGIDSDDTEGNEVGTCGGAISASGATTAPFGQINEIIDNTIARSRQIFLDTPQADSAIFIGGSSGFTMSGNIVRDATARVIDFAPNNVPEAWRNFVPAQVTSINGTTVSGTNGAGSPCPDCIIEIYSDDSDAKEEALELLATATADGNGDWTATLSSPLSGGFGIRTISRSAAVNVIGTLDAGTSSKMSTLFGLSNEIFNSGGFE